MQWNKVSLSESKFIRLSIRIGLTRKVVTDFGPPNLPGGLKL